MDIGKPVYMKYNKEMNMTKRNLIPNLITVIGAVVILTLSVPELVYYAPPIHVILFAVALVLGQAAIRNLIGGSR